MYVGNCPKCGHRVVWSSYDESFSENSCPHCEAQQRYDSLFHWDDQLDYMNKFMKLSETYRDRVRKATPPKPCGLD